MRFSITLEGDAGLLARFRKLETNVSRHVLRQACVHAIQPMLAEAKRRVPVGKRGSESRVLGKGRRLLYTVSSSKPHLRDNLSVAEKEWKTKLKAEASITRTQRFAYANPLESGAGPHEIRTPWPIPGGPRRVVRHPGHRPYPFLRPAYQLNWRQAVSSINGEIKRYVLAAWTGAGGNVAEKYDDKKGI